MNPDLVTTSAAFSAKQAIDSDRKIRAISLLKFSNISLTEIDSTIQPSNSDTQTCSTKYDSVTDQLLAILKRPQHHILRSGYTAQSVCRKTQCDHCSEALSNSNDLSPMDFNDVMPHTARTFFDSVNRGGPKTPTEFVFTLTVHCWRAYKEILAKSDLKSQFLATENHSVLFYKIMDRASYHHSSTMDSTTTCVLKDIIIWHNLSFNDSSTASPRSPSIN